MKKLMLVAVLVLLVAGEVFAQKLAYVDTEYILKNIPEYKDAQKSWMTSRHRGRKTLIPSMLKSTNYINPTRLSRYCLRKK